MNNKSFETNQQKKLFVFVGNGSELVTPMNIAEAAGHYTLGLLDCADETKVLGNLNNKSSATDVITENATAQRSAPRCSFWKRFNCTKNSSAADAITKDVIAKDATAQKVTPRHQFEKLLGSAKKELGIKSEDIYFYCEGNVYEPEKPEADPSSAQDFWFLAHSFIEEVEPGHLIIFSKTQGCQQFVNCWRELNQYSKTNWGSKPPYWKDLAQEKTLTFQPLPSEILVVDMEQVVSSVESICAKLRGWGRNLVDRFFHEKLTVVQKSNVDEEQKSNMDEEQKSNMDEEQKSNVDGEQKTVPLLMITF